jgi:hypothetical protein
VELGGNPLMAEYKLDPGAVPYVSTAEYHADRERAPHLEQEWHRPRMLRAAHFVKEAVSTLAPGWTDPPTLSDLGCGDGGFLTLVQDIPGLDAWGYDFAPANAAGWEERGVRATLTDAFDPENPDVELGEIVVITEVLEHLADPHGVLARVRDTARRLIVSSPWNEGPGNHSDCHAWAWDLEGYAAMLRGAGWTIERHEQVGLFQVVLAH